MAVESWLHLIYIVGAVIWVGGGLMLSVVGAGSDRAKTPTRSESSPSCCRMPACGFSARSSGGDRFWGLARACESFTQLWVLLALGAFVVAFLVGAIYLSRIARKASWLGSTNDTAGNCARCAFGRFDESHLSTWETNRFKID
jgi:hypothetical protein